MALRTVRVFLHNEATLPLTLTSATMDQGDWGDDGRQRPPATIPPGQTVMMRSESSGFPPAGTEAHVNYRIGSDSTQNVALHWDNPLAGGNKFNQETDPDHFVFRVGGPGNDAVVHFFLRDAGSRSTGFLPDRDGFQFDNHWPDTPYSLPPLRGSVLDLKYGNAANGLCGGMVFAARDYFESGMSIPPATTPPLGEQDPLFLYLVDRQFATFSVDTVSLMLKLMNPLYPDTDENVLSALGLASGRAGVMANEEWPLIRADIDDGRPSPMVLITVKSLLPWDLGKCHQVLAYAYDVHGDDIVLRVYDPNQRRDNDVHLHFNVRTVAERIVVDHNVAVRDDDGQSLRPIYCFARMNYAPKTPTVLTPPRPPRPPVEVPRQVSLEVVDGQTLSSTVIGKGRKSYDVFLCGTQEFDYTLVAQQQRVSIAAHAVSYIDPRVTWMLNDAPVPEGAGQTVRPHPSEPGDAYTDEDAAGPGARPPVAVQTTTDGMLLHVENVAGDGQYGLTARAVIAERDGSEAKRTTIAFGFEGTREIVPGLVEAWNQCVSDWLHSLQQESPTADAIAAAAAAQLGRPPDPIWDPDPLQAENGWQDAIIASGQAQLSDPAQQVNSSTVLTIDTGQDGTVTTGSGTEVVTVDPGVDSTVQVGTQVGGITIANASRRDLMIVNSGTHEAVTLVPADQQVTLNVVQRAPA
jgi:hypothetical protein